MAIFLLLSAAPKRTFLYKISCASVQHSLSPPESFIVVSDGDGDNEDAHARVAHSCDAADALLSPDNKTHNPVLLQTVALTNSHSIISI